MKKVAIVVIAALLMQISIVIISQADPGPDFDLLIITPEVFEDEIEPLKRFKDATGRPSTIVTLEDIYMDYTGDDKAEQIKKCIADYESTHNIKYVLLVGDVDKLPMRYFYLKRMNTTHVNWLQYYLTDHYYADLYNSTGGFCDWDANGNGIFGEIIDDDDDGDYTNVDGINFSFDVVVGRIPVNTEAEVERYVDKVIRYEKEVYYDSWFKNILLVTGTGDSIYPDASSTWDEAQNNQIATTMASAGFTSIKLYHSNDPAGSYYPNPTNINMHLNSGAGFMNVISHGNQYSWGVYDVRTDMSGLSNEDKLTVVYSFGCSTAKVGPIAAADSYIDVNETYRDYGTTYDPGYYPCPLSSWVEPAVPSPLQSATTDVHCMPEYWDFASSDGAVAFIGSTAEASSAMGSPVMQYFFQSFATDGYRVLGDVWNSVCNKVMTGGHAIDSNWDHARRWLYINLFGDPTLVLGGLPDKPPETTLSIGSPNITVGGDTYINGDTQMTLFATDDSAVDSIYYRYYMEGIPAPSFSLYTSPFTISGADGTYSIEYYSVDDGGNSEYPVNIQQVILDDTPPDINKTIGLPQYPDSGGTFITFTTPIWVNATDNGTGYVNLTVDIYNASGIEIAHYTAEVANGWAHIGPFNIAEECVHWINITARDGLNNTAYHNQTVYVDDSPPYSDVNDIIPYCQHVNETNELTITATAHDEPECGVGIANITLYYRFARYNHSFSPWIEFGIDNETPWQWQFNAPNGSGYYQFYTVARDFFGHSETMPDENSLPEAILSVTYNHSFKLYQGWNMICLPVKSSIQNADDLGNYINSFSSGACTVVTKWDASEQQYISRVVGVAGQNFEIEAGYGYFIFIDHDVELYIEGCLIEYDEINITLYMGYNLIGGANIENVTAQKLGENITGCWKISKWNASLGWLPECIIPWKVNNFDIKIGDAIFIYRNTGGVIKWNGGRDML